MAIYHCSMKPMSRASGRSAVAAAAYRSGETLTNERDGLRHDYSHRYGVSETSIILPEGVNAEWAQDRETLWNEAEFSENRKDSRVAREFEVSLPHELNAEQRSAAAQAFAQALADRYGAAVDMAIHEPHPEGDQRNHHAHLMMTTRQVLPEGLGEKTDIERENKWLAARGIASTQDQLREVRETWAGVANLHLAMAGYEARIDHRSHDDRGIDLTPTEHQGVHATQMERRGEEITRTRIDPAVARRNADLIREDPSQVLSIITAQQSVFDRRDVARTLHRYTDGVEDFQAMYWKVMQAPDLVTLAPEKKLGSGVVEPARLSTLSLMKLERQMADGVEALAGSESPPVSDSDRAAAFAAMPMLSEQQRGAVEHVTGETRIAAVVGLAGAGKSTMLSAARDAWERAGYEVHGGALAGKAADGLQAASGIESRTLASWELAWSKGRDTLGPNDVFVIDEAGMVSSRQMATFVDQANRSGAKLVLVGDPEQLQPIEAGASFRSIAEQVGFAPLDEVRRQNDAWQREATVALGQHRTEEGLAAYEEKRRLILGPTRSGARPVLVEVAIQDMALHPNDSRIVLAHRRVDVAVINAGIRERLKDKGELTEERTYATDSGTQGYAVGDRVMFGKNDRTLGVKNGQLGTVERTGNEGLEVRLDGAGPKDAGRSVSVALKDYSAIDYGYASTIHKAQGTTVDRAYVLGTKTMDRHLTYVAMSRHRVTAAMVAGQDDFVDLAALKKQLSRGRAKETTLDYLSGKTHREKEGREKEGKERESREGVPAAAPPASLEPSAPANEPAMHPVQVLWRARAQLDQTAREQHTLLEAPYMRQSEALSRALDQANKAVSGHEQARPTGLTGLFKQKAWKAELDGLSQSQQRSLKAWLESREKWQGQEQVDKLAKQARQQAEAKWPQLAALVKQDELEKARAQEQAKEQERARVEIARQRAREPGWLPNQVQEPERQRQLEREREQERDQTLSRGRGRGR